MGAAEVHDHSNKLAMGRGGRGARACLLGRLLLGLLGLGHLEPRHDLSTLGGHGGRLVVGRSVRHLQCNEAMQ